LAIKGLHVLRFTGSEITRNPDKCTQEIDRLLISHREIWEKVKKIFKESQKQ
jgi:very-short-patch-repair endonuclease